MITPNITEDSVIIIMEDKIKLKLFALISSEMQPLKVKSYFHFSKARFLIITTASLY